MSLREDMYRYEKLTGESAEHIPIIKIGAYLDGYEKGIEKLEKIKAEIEELIQHCDTDYDFDEIYGIRQTINVIDKHIKENK